MKTRALTAAEVIALPAMPNAWPDAGRACGIGRTAWYELIAKGETPVPVVRIGRALKVRRSDLLNFLGIKETAAVVETAAASEENDDAPGVEPGAPVEQASTSTSQQK
ncbi:AlpA family transcriptional regulator [Streptomyces sp. MK5]|uniref:helix-turn-helix transcriptional regulator n=1 Tax=Streptomyces sp. MK5 TaxID=3064253 RepID=UPI0027421936|nr:helix-turn-helix domain-containing protein [Streptomyces sp. MK5]